MKTRTWIFLLALILVLCVGLSLWLLWPKQAQAVEIWSEGELLQTLSLQTDTTLTVQTSKGVNVITVQGGRIAVTQADCPDKYCVKRGFCSGGAQIVCLPHRLVLKFVAKSAVDGVAG